jgi:hypothetical protein
VDCRSNARATAACLHGRWRTPGRLPTSKLEGRPDDKAHKKLPIADLWDALSVAIGNSNAGAGDVEFGEVIRELAAEAKLLDREVGRVGEPPTPSQLNAVQDAINRMQRKLNRLQTALDAWTEQTQV